MKECSYCHKTKPMSGFWHNITAKDGYFNRCIDCCRIYNRERYHMRKEEKKTEKKKMLPFIYHPTVPIKPRDPPTPLNVLIIERPITLTFE